MISWAGMMTGTEAYSTSTGQGQTIQAGYVVQTPTEEALLMQQPLFPQATVGADECAEINYN